VGNGVSFVWVVSFVGVLPWGSAVRRELLLCLCSGSGLLLDHSAHCLVVRLRWG
jgi:hypothetical protein